VLGGGGAGLACVLGGDLAGKLDGGLAATSRACWFAACRVRDGGEDGGLAGVLDSGVLGGDLAGMIDGDLAVVLDGGMLGTS
jgi:hypothetical protein